MQSRLKQSETIRVLLVEADPAYSRELRRLIEQGSSGKYEVCETSGVELALALLLEKKFDVLLLDLSLPDSEGLDTLLRAKGATASVPIVALTNDEDEDQAVDVLRLGAQEHLVKSQLDARSLARNLRHAVERHQLISQLRDSREREHYLATHDALTNLPNRFHFQNQLSRSLAYASRHDRQLAVLFLDLDGFKTINDTLGHANGDALLAEVAARLARVVRRSDMVARLGGDEFVVMIQDVTDDRAAERAAETVLDSLARAYHLAGQDYWLTTSIGIAMFQRDGEDVETLVRSADMALYQAKRQGRNNVQFYRPAMNAQARQRLSIETRIRTALENEEFRLYYQPKVEILSGRIVGTEALLRWCDPERGIVAPSEFIPIAEETGLIVPLGAWALRTACAQTKRWQEAGFPTLRVAVNLSPHQVCDRSLRDTVVKALWDSGLAPDSLELEITESALMRNENVAVEVLGELKTIGIRVSLDDFGTGFSSLNYLKRFPVDTVKIDRSFIDDITVDRDDRVIVDAILSIADKLQLISVAEGVETLEQLDLLRVGGCDQVQGYLYSPPVPADHLGDLLGRSNLLTDPEKPEED